MNARNQLLAAAIALTSLGGLMTSANAAPADSITVAARAEHAQRMQLIGRTARYDEQATVASADTELDTTAARQQAYVARAERAGRTVQFGDVAPAAVAADPAPRNVDEAIANYKERMTLIGRTVQANELPDVREAATLSSSR
jgi:hypothetical protein